MADKIAEKFSITFLDDKMMITSEENATFVDIVERDEETGQIIKQVLGTVNKEAIKEKYKDKLEQK